MDEKILDPDHTVMAIFPSPMMYAGPTEARLMLAFLNFIIPSMDRLIF